MFYAIMFIICLDMTNYEVVETTESGLQILKEKPLLERHYTPGNYVSATIVILLLALAIYGVFQALWGIYKVVASKEKTVKLKGKEQIKKGIRMFVICVAIWVVINIFTAFLGVDTLCMSMSISLLISFLIDKIAWKWLGSGRLEPGSFS